MCPYHGLRYISMYILVRVPYIYDIDNNIINTWSQLWLSQKYILYIFIFQIRFHLFQ